MVVLLVCVVAAVGALGLLQLMRRSPGLQRERRRAIVAREWAGAERELLLRGAEPERLEELRAEILGP